MSKHLLETCSAGKHAMILNKDECPYCDIERLQDNAAREGRHARKVQIERLKARLERINDIACYITEEDTDARYHGLLEIGRIARGEPEDNRSGGAFSVEGGELIEGDSPSSANKNV